LLLRAVRAIEQGLADLRQGKPVTPENAVDLKAYEEIVDMGYWASIERRFGAREN
jgi:hypothetical protein